MSQTVTGVVENISVKDGKSVRGRPWTKFGFQVNGSWYSGFRTAVNATELSAPKEGDTVDLEYEVNGE